MNGSINPADRIQRGRVGWPFYWSLSRLPGVRIQIPGDGHRIIGFTREACAGKRML